MRHYISNYCYGNPRQKNQVTGVVSINQKIESKQGNEKEKEQPCPCEEVMKKCKSGNNENDSFICDFDETSIYEYDCECLRQKKSCF